MDPHIQFENVTVAYDSHAALRDISMTIPGRSIFGIIGPANSGKTTLLKCINRTIDFVSTAKVTGRVSVGGENVYGMRNVYELRRRVGMVFALPIALPMTIEENVTYGLRMQGERRQARLAQRVIVMYAGYIVEDATVKDFYANPRHPYSIGLLNSLPRLNEAPGTKLIPIPGQPPDVVNLPLGCPFVARCTYAVERCRHDMPPLEIINQRNLVCSERKNAALND